jgi:hypothetical protein
MRNLARHCMSNQSSGPRTDTRTGQIMPHRRSSDVASAVWSIDEESISRAFTLSSVMCAEPIRTDSCTCCRRFCERTFTALRERVTHGQHQSTAWPHSPVSYQNSVSGERRAHGSQEVNSVAIQCITFRHQTATVTK